MCHMRCAVVPLQTPLIMTTIQTNTGSIFLGPGIWMTATAGVTVVACIALLKLHPTSNK